MGVKERVADALARVAAQSVASWVGATNATAHVSYTGSESRGEGWHHSDQLSESHSYSHDPKPGTIGE